MLRRRPPSTTRAGATARGRDSKAAPVRGSPVRLRTFRGVCDGHFLARINLLSGADKALADGDDVSSFGEACDPDAVALGAHGLDDVKVDPAVVGDCFDADPAVIIEA